ncbi:hypothetical protein [Sinomonas sp. R1AF57]|nr:hypothetical protein [Sinomonas sp. R1AF57]
MHQHGAKEGIPRRIAMRTDKTDRNYFAVAVMVSTLTARAAAIR